MFCYKNGLTFDPLQSDLLKESVQNHHGAAKCTQVAKSKYFQNHSAHTPLNATLINQWPEVHRRIKKKCLFFSCAFFLSPFVFPFTFQYLSSTWGNGLLAFAKQRQWKLTCILYRTPVRTLDLMKHVPVLKCKWEPLLFIPLSPISKNLIMPIIDPSFHDTRDQI